MRCWAEALGGCDPKLSREHVVTESLWDGGKITVQGLPWCPTPKTIGLGSATAKILCRAHNSRLSPVDVAGKEAFAHLKEAASLGVRRGRIPPRQWMLFAYDIDGPLLERWFLKTAINLWCIHPNRPEWLVKAEDGLPPLPLVGAAMGEEPLPPPMGLHAAAMVGAYRRFTDMVEFAPLLLPDGRMAGALFTFRGFQFVLGLAELPLPPTLRFGTQESAWEGASLLYHIRAINCNVGGQRSHVVEFHWP